MCDIRLHRVRSARVYTRRDRRRRTPLSIQLHRLSRTGGDQVQGVALMSGKFRRASTDEEIADIIRKGVAGTAMQAFNFSEQQAGMIVAYLKSFAAAPTTATANAPELGDSAR